VIAENSSATQTASWLVVATQPHRELFATDNLVRQDYNVYCPVIMRHIRHARRAYDARRPLFPGYLFVEDRPDHRSLFGTYGVRSIVRNGDSPALLPASFIAALRERESGGVIVKQTAALRPGQAVAINGGPFDGLVGKIIEVRESDRVLLLLDLMNTQTKLNVNARMLRSA
jgi:transcriptional antiterminator RfaH